MLIKQHLYLPLRDLPGSSTSSGLSSVDTRTIREQIGACIGRGVCSYSVVILHRLVRSTCFLHSGTDFTTLYKKIAPRSLLRVYVDPSDRAAANVH